MGRDRHGDGRRGCRATGGEGITSGIAGSGRGLGDLEERRRTGLSRTSAREGAVPSVKHGVGEKARESKSLRGSEAWEQ
ncbi:hypothetical protein PR202_gb17396 [Eleusine coracana subsp. coracana]|uniref:Uncharacterized protein n=1 Tax=Eleusine coracana subsp. coracana TaxID=191504 RepID=A0AAV5F0I8_ELECO|nr:hypothetical protein PR202_gb17396 [Eleusine coracana subsp. coracana]